MALPVDRACGCVEAMAGEKKDPKDDTRHPDNDEGSATPPAVGADDDAPTLPGMPPVHVQATDVTQRIRPHSIKKDEDAEDEPESDPEAETISPSTPLRRSDLTNAETDEGEG